MHFCFCIIYILFSFHRRINLDVFRFSSSEFVFKETSYKYALLICPTKLCIKPRNFWEIEKILTVTMASLQAMIREIMVKETVGLGKGNNSRNFPFPRDEDGISPTAKRCLMGERSLWNHG